VAFVHGAGYLQNSDMGWPDYFREGMFHSMLAEQGYVVIDMDYRASEGYGRDWRTAIYRQMGVPELEDYKDGVDFMVENYGVNPDRVGIYGGSYGGFMAFVAMFRAPDLFKAGAALRPVSDWAHYNHGYTANILNTPGIDPEAFYISSPINYVEGLQGALLIEAGMQDDNVFFQDSVFVVQRLIELQKEDFEIALYPQDPHGFKHPESWLDGYRRIYKLFEENLK
jgi:dipeptidyl aminopeptidase/acylaminoacyl peptidase